MRGQSRSPLPRTPILTRPFPGHTLTEPPPNYPFVVGSSRQTPQQTSRGTKRKTVTPTALPFGARATKALALDQRAVRRTKQVVKKRATQAAKKKARQTANKGVSKLVKSWLKFK